VQAELSEAIDPNGFIVGANCKSCKIRSSEGTKLNRFGFPLAPAFTYLSVEPCHPRLIIFYLVTMPS
jgi:hypothetical protein